MLSLHSLKAQQQDLAIFIIRPEVAVGRAFGVSDSINPLTFSYGLKAFFTANPSMRIGLRLDYLSMALPNDEKQAYINTGILLEILALPDLNVGMGIGGYIGQGKLKGSNPFAFNAHMGYEINFANTWFLLLAYQLDLIFAPTLISNNALKLGFGVGL